MTPAHRRLLALAERQQDAHLTAARGLVLTHFRQVALVDAEKALKAALNLPKSQRPKAIREAVALVDTATRALRIPPADLGPVLRAAVRDRVLNTDDLAALSNPALKFNDSGELQRAAVTRQRQVMRKYWTKEGDRFMGDVAATMREAARRGLDPEQVADLLQARLGVHRSRAVLIAVDQTLTVAQLASQKRMRDLGFTSFLWVSRRDGDVRKAHQERDGQVYSFRGAPELPGQAVRCRCIAAPPPVSP
ncbi:minor capsid protein [Deinococcus humi]|uniref:SPP1 gp7 family putative phage head morphogenesis protein n=1 Tax=Deinococcus humi TaxID=662880 RepID=A0A7W8JVR2_9DEIO|nr:minor capsid protein [Deinococcus humi]MBB5364009.1 SPP1 gp7 family putative phage head morphogenesis protein [Deinococcus humi]